MAQGMMSNPEGMEEMMRELNLGAGPHMPPDLAAGAAAGAATRRSAAGGSAFVQGILSEATCGGSCVGMWAGGR